MSNIITVSFDAERIIREGETAVDRYVKSREEAKSQIIPMARGLLAARKKYRDNQSLGGWLIDSSYSDLNRTDRAALIKIAEHEAFLAPVIASGTLTSAQEIWKAYGEQASSWAMNTPVETRPEPESAPQSITTPIEPVLADPNEPKSETRPQHHLTGSGAGQMKNPEAMKLPKQLGVSFDDVALVLKTYPYNRQKTLKAQFSELAETSRSKKAVAVRLFAMALETVKSGRAPQLSNGRGFDPRIIIPNVPEAFCKYYSLADLADHVDRLQLLDSTAAQLQAANTSAETIHTHLAHIWQHGCVPQPVPAPKVEIASTDSKNKIKHEVKYCGKLIWPREALKDVTYDDLNAGWHLVDYWVQYLETATPQKPREIGTLVRHLVYDIAAASSNAGLVEVMLVCVGAYSEANEHLSKNDLSNSMAPGLAR